MCQSFLKQLQDNDQLTRLELLTATNLSAPQSDTSSLWALSFQALRALQEQNRIEPVTKAKSNGAKIIVAWRLLGKTKTVKRKASKRK
jgi:hypothetical protein